MAHSLQMVATRARASITKLGSDFTSYISTSYTFYLKRQAMPRPNHPLDTIECMD